LLTSAALVNGDVHAANVPASIRHSIVTGEPVAVNVNVGWCRSSAVRAAGDRHDRRDGVDGERLAGGAVLPTASVPRT
jgi:hypothetical protein